MKITIANNIVLVPVGNVTLPDYGVRRLEVMETIEQEVIITDSGGRMAGIDFSVTGVLTQTGLSALSTLTNAPIGSYTEVDVVITSGTAIIWTAKAYPQRITGITLYGGTVLYADASTGFTTGSRLASVTVEFKFKMLNT